ncbi:MAG: response regulator transcription factor [Bacteroidales bacterium]|nr:response regulator transcription factor [Bacteroidales bacterium]
MNLIGEIRQHHEGTAILVLRAGDAIDTKVQGLEQGGDDYLIKPFHKAELKARVHSILRGRISGGSRQIQFNELTVDLSARKATIHNKVLNLTRKEYDLLLFTL